MPPGWQNSIYPMRKVDKIFIAGVFTESRIFSRLFRSQPQAFLLTSPGL